MMSARLIAKSQPLYNFARIDNGERKPRLHNATPVITAHCLTVCVDHLHRPHLVFCYLLTACDCSAISPCTTTVRPHEPSSRNVRRLHVMLTADLQSGQSTVQLPSPRAQHQCVRMSRRHDTFAVSTTY